MRYVPMLPELACELGRYPAWIGEDRIPPPNRGAISGNDSAWKENFEDPA